MLFAKTMPHGPKPCWLSFQRPAGVMDMKAYLVFAGSECIAILATWLYMKCNKKLCVNRIALYKDFCANDKNKLLVSGLFGPMLRLC